MIETLSDFKNLIDASVRLKRKLVKIYYMNKSLKRFLFIVGFHKTIEKHIKALENLYFELISVKKKNDKFVLKSEEGSEILLDLMYEKQELKKDLIFLRDGEHELLEYIIRKNKEYQKEFNDLKKAFSNFNTKHFNNFITDRDGTINNYCGLYMSSAQSLYNSIFISNFVKKHVKNLTIITSAPLSGLLSLSVFPSKKVILAGSKGREYFRGKIKTAYISPDKQESIKMLHNEIEELLSSDKYKKFKMIGSGFQEKFGQLTIARQDISNSISKSESLNFLKIITSLVKKVDPQNEVFSIEDTGLDVEIIAHSTEGTSYDKSNGVNFLNSELNLNLSKGVNIVSGDTMSDIPMIEECISLNERTIPIFITSDNALRKKVKSKINNVVFISNPDSFVVMLDRLSRDFNLEPVIPSSPKIEKSITKKKSSKKVTKTKKTTKKR